MSFLENFCKCSQKNLISPHFLCYLCLMMHKKVVFDTNRKTIDTIFSIKLVLY